jgi:hypothetical protein
VGQYDLPCDPPTSTPMTSEGQTVVYLNEVVAKLQDRLSVASAAVQQKVLPGARRHVMAPLMEADAMLASIIEVLDRSGMGKRLGFILRQDGIQPVIKAETATETITL